MALPATLSIPSNLPAEVVAERLQHDIDEGRPLAVLRGMFVVVLRGTVSPSLALSVDLRGRPERGSRWRARPIASGSIEPRAQGSVVDVTIAMTATGAGALKRIMVGLLLVAMAFGITLTLLGPPSRRFDLTTGWWLPGLGAFAVGFVILRANARAILTDADMLIGAIRRAAAD